MPGSEERAHHQQQRRTAAAAPCCSAAGGRRGTPADARPERHRADGVDPGGADSPHRLPHGCSGRPAHPGNALTGKGHTVILSREQGWADARYSCAALYVLEREG